MATASIQLPNGTRVTIDGTPEEISKVLELYGPKTPVSDLAIGERVPRKSRTSNGATQYIKELIDEGFFAERRSLADVQRSLEDLGHIFPLNQLSTPLRRLVVSRLLRRLKDGRNWVYVRAS